MHTQWRNIDIRTFAMLASLALSVWHVLANPIPNADAFDYVRTAHIYLEQGLGAAFAHYPSATYPVLMGIVQQLSGMNLFLAGQFINGIFYALIVYAFISLALEVRHTRRVAVLAALVILVFPTLNEYRYYLIRDIGFIALMLLSALQLIRYSKCHASGHGVAYILLVLGAALFRAEALAYLPLTPLALLGGARPAWRAVLKLEAAIVASASVALLGSLVSDLDVPGTIQRILAVYWPFVRDAVLTFSGRDSPLSIAIFGEYAANFSGRYTWLFMLTGLSAILFAKLFSGFGLPTLLILVYGVRQQRREFAHPNLRPVFAYALISLFILLAFLVLTRFISARYTMLLSLCILVTLPLLLDKALIHLQRIEHKKLAQGILGFLLLFSTVDAHISFGASRDSLQQASAWLAANTEPGDNVFTNNNYIAYHSGRVEDYDLVTRYISADALANTPYGTIIALSLSDSISKQLQHSLEFRQLQALAAFPNNEEPTVLIYKRLGN